MRIRFILSLLILIFACALQSWFASMDVFMNFILASLIVFAFFFDVWELLVFILFSIFVINWQPAISAEIILFGLVPLAAYAFHQLFAFVLWVAVPIAIIVGFLIFYIAIAPTMFFINWMPFLTDLVGGLVFGELVLLALEKNAR